MLSGEIARRYGHTGLPDDTITFRFHGSAGQSFGAFAMKGLTMILTGDSNDYIGKGLSGARIVVRPPEDAAFDPASNVVIGNVPCTGRLPGSLFLRTGRRTFRHPQQRRPDRGGRRGDHGCEYMTGEWWSFWDGPASTSRRHVGRHRLCV
jgi:glutamate synthase domain-containing protein 3